MCDNENKPSAAACYCNGIISYMINITTDKKERKRVKKILTKMDQQIIKIQTKLNNPDFLANASTKVIASEYDHLNNLLPEQKFWLKYYTELYC